MSDLDMDIILGLAAHGMNVRKTARALGKHWNSVYYRIEKIRDTTKLDPLDFYDLEELLEIVKEELSEQA